MHHAPAGILPSDVHPVKTSNHKYGFYELYFYMPAIGSNAKRYKRNKNPSTMFPNDWTPEYVQMVINKGYLIAFKKGGDNPIIQLSDILGLSYRGIKLQYHMKASHSGQPYVYPVLH